MTAPRRGARERVGLTTDAGHVLHESRHGSAASRDPIYCDDPDCGLVRKIRAIESEAHDQALGLLLLTGTPGEHFPTSVLSFDNVKKATEAVERRIRSQIEAAR